MRYLGARPSRLRTSATSDKPLAGHTGQLPDHVDRLGGAGRLNHRQIETVAGKPGQGLSVLDELDQKRCGSTGTAWPAIEITQERRLVFTAKQDFWIALGEMCRNRRGAYNGA